MNCPDCRCRCRAWFGGGWCVRCGVVIGRAKPRLPAERKPRRPEKPPVLPRPTNGRPKGGGV
jgi:hypothetical protein